MGCLDPEAELAGVVSRPAHNLALETARSAQKSDELWISGKSPGTFTPLGPWSVVGLKDDGVPISIVHNGTQLSPPPVTTWAGAWMKSWCT